MNVITQRKITSLDIFENIFNLYLSETSFTITAMINIGNGTKKSIIFLSFSFLHQYYSIFLRLCKAC